MAVGRRGVAVGGHTTPTTLASPSSMSVVRLVASLVVVAAVMTAVPRVAAQFECIVTATTGVAGLALSAATDVQLDTTRNGTLLIVDSKACTVWRLSGDATVTKVLGGTCGATTGVSVVAASGAPLGLPSSVWVPPFGGGIFYMAEPASSVIRMATLDATLKVVAGTYAYGTAVSGSTATTQKLAQPSTVRSAQIGNDVMLVSDTAVGVLYRVTPAGVIEVLATGLAGLWDAQPDGFGGYIVTSNTTHTVTHILPGGSRIVIAGTSGSSGYSGDGGAGSSAKLFAPTRLLRDGSGGWYIADTGNAVIRRLYSNSTIVTVAGTGVRSSTSDNGDGGHPLAARFAAPIAMESDGLGGVYVGDLQAARVRQLLPASVCNVRGRLRTCSKIGAAGTNAVSCVLYTLPTLLSFRAWANSVACSVTTAPTVSGDKTATVACPMPTGSTNLALLWSTPLGNSSITVYGGGSVTLQSATPRFALGATVMLALAVLSDASLVLNKTALSSSSASDVSLPCSSPVLAGTLRSGTLRCTLPLWSDPWAAGDVTLVLWVSEWEQPLRIAVTVPTSALPTSLPQLTTPAVVVTPRSTVAFTLPATLPATSEYTADQLMLPAGCTCAPQFATLRAWVGGVPSSYCTWATATTANCVVPAAPAFSQAALFSRLVVEVCCAYNVTSDGRAPTATTNLSTASGTVAFPYNPSPLLDTATTAGTVSWVHADGSGVASIKFTLAAGAARVLASLSSRVWVGGSECGGVRTVVDTDTLECTAWTWPADASFTAASVAGSAAMTVSVTLRDVVVNSTAGVVLAFAPLAVAVLPTTTAPGSCIAILGHWLAGDAAASIKVVLGDSRTLCTDISHVRTSSIKCCLPTVISPTTTGYPTLLVTVVNSRGAGTGNATVTVPVNIGAAFDDTVLQYMAMPAAIDTASGSVDTTKPWAYVTPAVTLSASGSGQATCTMVVAAASCPRGGGAADVSLAGVSSVVIALPSGTPIASASLAGVAVVARLGCAVNVTAACADDLGRTTVTPTSAMVNLGNLILTPGWDTTDPPAIVVTPEGMRPAMTATVAPDATAFAVFMERGSGADLENQVQCSAAVITLAAAATITSSAPAGTLAAGILQTTACTTTALNDGSGSVAVACAATALPSTAGVAMDPEYTIVLYCTYRPTGDVLTAPSQRMLVPTFNVTVVGDATSTLPLTSLSLLAGTDVGLTAVLTATLPAGTPAAYLRAVANTTATCAWKYATLATDASIATTGSAIVDYPVYIPVQLGTTVVRGGSGELSIPTLQLVAAPGTGVTVTYACTVAGMTVVSDPVAFRANVIRVMPVSTLPTTFVPCDSGARWLLPLPVAVAVGAVEGGSITATPLLAGGGTCTLAVAAAEVAAANAAGDTAVIPALVTRDAATSSAAYVDVDADDDGVVTFPPFGLRTALAAASLNLTVACRRANGDVPTALTWSLAVAALRTTLCTPAAVLASSQVGIGVTVSVVGPCAAVASGGGSGDPGSGDPGASSGGSVTYVTDMTPEAAALVALDLPTITCHATTDDTSVVVQGGSAIAGLNGTTEWPSISMTAPIGTALSLDVVCMVGSLVIPPAAGSVGAINVSITGCSPGTQAFGVFCQRCSTGQFGLGGGTEHNCTACPPAGVACDGGILTLLPHYYRPPEARHLPITADTDLYPCYNAEACLLNHSAGTDGSYAYGCERGYTGVLCGVCDAANGYARMGTACRVCFQASTNAVLLGFLAAGALGVLGFAAWKATDTSVDASVVLRITLAFIQAAGALRVFRAGRTAAYDEIMGWTDIVSANPLSVGALQCVTRMSYLLQYLATISLPAIAAVIVILLFFVGTIGRACHCKPRPRFSCREVRTAVAKWHASRRHVAALLFVLSLTYMPIVSASLRALDCISAVAGHRYLRSDLSIECGVGQHAVARGVAYIVLVVIGIGFPVGLVWLLGTATPEQLADPDFHAGWGFLYDGYHVPQAPLSGIATSSGGSKASDAPPSPGGASPRALHAPGSLRSLSTLSIGMQSINHRARQRCQFGRHNRSWWEGLVILRKAGVVLLAVLVTNPYMQCAGATLWFSGFLHLQVTYAPYAKARFNYMETASLAASFLTSAISTVLLQFNVGRSDADQHTIQELGAIEWTVTVFLVILSLGTLLSLGGTWVMMQAYHMGAVLSCKQRRAAPANAPAVAPAPAPAPLHIYLPAAAPHDHVATAHPPRRESVTTPPPKKVVILMPQDVSVVAGSTTSEGGGLHSSDGASISAAGSTANDSHSGAARAASNTRVVIGQVPSPAAGTRAVPASATPTPHVVMVRRRSSSPPPPGATEANVSVSEIYGVYDGGDRVGRADTTSSVASPPMPIRHTVVTPPHGSAASDAPGAGGSVTGRPGPHHSMPEATPARSSSPAFGPRSPSPIFPARSP